MNKQNLSIKILLAATVSTFFFLGLTAYSINKVKNDDTLTVAKIEEAVKKTYNLKNFHISAGSSGVIIQSEDYTKKIEAPAFQKIDIKTVSSDIQVLKTDDTHLTIKADINIDNMMVTEGSDLVIDQTDDSPLSSLQIYVPENFTGEIQIKTVSGNIRVDSSAFSQIKINTISGDLDIANNFNANLEIQSVSGDVEIRNKKSAQDFSFSLQTVSGDIENSLSSHEDGKHRITVKTVSGDIRIR